VLFPIDPGATTRSSFHWQCGGAGSDERNLPLTDDEEAECNGACQRAAPWNNPLFYFGRQSPFALPRADVRFARMN
jgi:hypothetical protein